MSSLRFLSLRTVLDIVHFGPSRDSRRFKLQKEEFKIYNTRPIKRQVRLIENRNLQNLNQAQSPRNV